MERRRQCSDGFRRLGTQWGINPKRALNRAGSPAELHVDATGDHDFGVRQDEKGDLQRLPSFGERFQGQFRHRTPPDVSEVL
jgi:hypothetical protein